MAKNKAIKDTDYLYASARIKSLEKNLLTRDRLERMSEAGTTKDALKLLGEYGWPELAGPIMPAMEEALSSRRSEAFSLVRSIAPDKRLPDAFLIKYDYHNLKTLLKSEATFDDAEDLLIESGRFPVRQLRLMLQENSFFAMSKRMAESIAEARDVLARTRDPQLMDMILDKAMYADMLEMAESVGSKFLTDYVALMIDSVNLRSAVRLRRMGKGAEALRYAMMPGGGVSVSRLLGDVTPDLVEAVFNTSPLAAAAQTGARALRGEASLSDVDMACDDALLKHLKKAKYVAFGAEPLIGYLAAVEAELTSVRTVIAGRLAGLAADIITERLRDSYV